VAGDDKNCLGLDLNHSHGCSLWGYNLQSLQSAILNVKILKI
jgi:hypothetical protein